MADQDDELHLLDNEPLSPEAASSDSVFSVPEIHLPIVGCEILEARSRFTVYKVCVQIYPGNTWFVFRRYSEFYNLYSGLRQIYPNFYIQFPRKKYFGDNFDERFLTFRRKGLQEFLNKVLELENVLSKKVMVEFLCLDDPPGPFDSLEQSRAFMIHLEDSLNQMKRKYNEKLLEINAYKWHCAQIKAQRLVLLSALRSERAVNGKDLLENEDELLIKEYLEGSNACQITQSQEILFRNKPRSSGSFRQKMSSSSSCNSLLEAHVTLAKVSSPRTSWYDSTGSTADNESLPLHERVYKKPNTSHLPSYDDGGGLFNKILCRSTEALQKLKEVVKSSFAENATANTDANKEHEADMK